MSKKPYPLWFVISPVLLLAVAIGAWLVFKPSSIQVAERAWPSKQAERPKSRQVAPVAANDSLPVNKPKEAASSPACEYFEVWMTLQAGKVTRGCVGMAETTQLGTSWRYRFDGDNDWSVELKAIGGDVQSVSVTNSEGQFVCRGERCRAVRIDGPNQAGEKRIVLASTLLYRPGDEPSPQQRPAARARAELFTPEAKPICGGDALRVLYDDGTGLSFCSTTVDTDMSRPHRRVYTFSTLDGDQLRVGVDDAGDIVEVVYDGGAYRCVRTACAGVAIDARGGPMDVQKFRFGATTLLRLNDDASRPQTVALYGALIIPSADF